MSYLGEDIKKLGFGLMRLPQLEDGKIDVEQTKQMVDSSWKPDSPTLTPPGLTQAVKTPSARPW